jgi:hypothetical protein
MLRTNRSIERSEGMAKIGTTTQRWTRTIDREDRTGKVRRDYGLRDDGVLLRKVTFLDGLGSVDFTAGWEVVARDPKAIAKIVEDLTMRLGFTTIQ